MFKGANIIITLWVLGMLLNLAIIGGMIYVVLHFITKYW